MDERLEISSEKRKKKIDISKYLFLVAILIVPLACFIVFYLVVNFNSIIMAFQRWDSDTLLFEWAGFENFVEFFNRLKLEDKLIYSFKNSTITLLLNLFVALPLCLFVSYCVTEKLPLFGFFKIVLFIPSIVSAFALVMVGQQVINYVLPDLLGFPNTLLTGEQQFMTVTIYTLFIGFAGNMVLYIGAMSSVPKDVMEYARIDGCGFMRRFVHVVLPTIWPTITTMMITLFTNFFVSYGSMFSFVDQWARDDSYTLGYYLYVMIFKASGSAGTTFSYAEYPLAAAMGVMFTLVAIPVVFGVRYAMNKLGPKED